MTVHCAVLVNTEGCESPPLSEGPPVRTRCYRCGRDACRACSQMHMTRLVSTAARRVRICNDCMQHEPTTTREKH